MRVTPLRVVTWLAGIIVMVVVLGRTRSLRQPSGAGGGGGGGGNDALAGARERRGGGRAPKELIVATHGILGAFNVEDGTTRVIHSGRGVYHGVFPDDEPGREGEEAVWVVSRPHNWRPAATKEVLLRVGITSGEVLDEKVLPTKFAHDAARRGDRVYVTSTDTGAVVELAYPSMATVRTHNLFTSKQHVNTLHVSDDGATLWAMLHNKGQTLSDIVQVDLETDTITRKIVGVGSGAHCVVRWRSSFLALDSNNGRLNRVDLATNTVVTVWTHPTEGGTKWFLKGMAVVEDVAYIGVSPATDRKFRTDPNLSGAIAAVDLETGFMLWKRPVPSKGLINLVAAPHLAESSTYAAVHSWDRRLQDQLELKRRRNLPLPARPNSAGAGAGVVDAEQAPPPPPPPPPLPRAQPSRAQALSMAQDAFDAANCKGFKKTSDTRPAAEKKACKPLKIALENAQQAHDEHDEAGAGRQRGPAAVHRAEPNSEANSEARGRMRAEDSINPMNTGKYNFEGLPVFPLTEKKNRATRHPFQLHIANIDHALMDALRDKIEAQGPSVWEPSGQLTNAMLTNREATQKKWKPGVSSINFIFSDRTASKTFIFPWYRTWSNVLEPIIHPILNRFGVDLRNVNRLQLALMNPGSTIREHCDLGPWVKKSHRTHIVVTTVPEVTFVSRCDFLSGPPDLDTKWCPVHLNKGEVFELNNNIYHKAENPSTDGYRIHLILDWGEVLHQPQDFDVGQTCDYAKLSRSGSCGDKHQPHPQAS